MKSNPTHALQYRQGDIFFRQVESIHPNARQVQNEGPLILAEGEATGHHHAILKPENVTLYRQGKDAVFLRVAEREATVSHPEHAPIVLPMGDYEMIRQREYQPEANRHVFD